jgi:hypothetical protein
LYQEGVKVLIMENGQEKEENIRVGRREGEKILGFHHSCFVFGLYMKNLHKKTNLRQHLGKLHRMS